MHGMHCRTQSMQAITVEVTMRRLQRVATQWAAVAMMTAATSAHTHVRAPLESWEMGSTGLGGAPTDGQGRVASGAVVTVDNTKPRVDECVTLACRPPPTQRITHGHSTTRSHGLPFATPWASHCFGAMQSPFSAGCDRTISLGHTLTTHVHTNCRGDRAHSSPAAQILNDPLSHTQRPPTLAPSPRVDSATS
jgi:hypothetical protein